MAKVLTTILVLALAFLIGQGQAAPFATPTQISPWVYRGSTDAHHDWITFSLGKNVFASYSASDGALSQVWKGSLALEEREGANVPALARTNLAVLVDAATSKTWELRDGDMRTQLTAELAGIRWDDGQVIIRSRLRLEGREDIEIEETPRFLDNKELDAFYGEMTADPSAEWPFDGNSVAMLARRLRVANLPQKGQLILHWNRTRKSVTSVDGATEETDKQQPGYDAGATEPILLSIVSTTIVLHESIEL